MFVQYVVTERVLEYIVLGIIRRAARRTHFHPISSSRNALFEMASERRLPTFRAKRTTRGFTWSVAVFVDRTRRWQLQALCATEWKPPRKHALMGRIK